MKRTFNKITNQTQHALYWHVDHVKLIRVDPKVNKKFSEWCELTYGSKELGSAEVNGSKSHEYLVMKLYYFEKGKLKEDAKDCPK